MLKWTLSLSFSLSEPEMGQCNILSLQYVIDCIVKLFLKLFLDIHFIITLLRYRLHPSQKVAYSMLSPVVADGVKRERNQVTLHLVVSKTNASFTAQITKVSF